MTEFQLHSRFVPEFTWAMLPTAHPSAANRQQLRQSASTCACCGQHGKISHRARAGFACACTFKECESERCYGRFQHPAIPARMLGLVHRRKSDRALEATGVQHGLETPAEVDDRREYVEQDDGRSHDAAYRRDGARRAQPRRLTPVKALALLVASASSDALTCTVGVMAALLAGRPVVDTTVEPDTTSSVRWARRIVVLVDRTHYRVRATDRNTELLLQTRGFKTEREALDYAEMLRERLVGNGDHVQVDAYRPKRRSLIVVNEKQRRITVKLDRAGGRVYGTKRYATDEAVAEAYRRIVEKLDATGRRHRTWHPAGTRREMQVA